MNALPLQEQANELLYPIQERLPNLQEDQLPDVVYHYTDSAGLLGILSSGSVWATDYRFLNDSSELAYTFSLAAGIAADQVAQADGLGASFLEYVATNARPEVYDETPYYLACFSAVQNSLSQWRAYGGRQGFSLTFPGDISTSRGYSAGRRQNPGLTLLRVIYDEAIHRSYVEALLRELLSVCESPVMSRFDSPTEALASFTPFYWAQLDRASYRFKHPDFAVEEEWRLVAWGHVHPESFRAGHTVIPFTKFQIFSESRSHESGRLPLMQVRHGPSDSASSTLIGLDRALTANGYPPDCCERLGSTTPVRL